MCVCVCDVVSVFLDLCVGVLCGYRCGLVGPGCLCVCDVVHVCVCFLCVCLYLCIVVCGWGCRWVCGGVGGLGGLVWVCTCVCMFMQSSAHVQCTLPVCPPKKGVALF